MASFNWQVFLTGNISHTSSRISLIVLFLFTACASDDNPANPLHLARLEATVGASTLSASFGESRFDTIRVIARDEHDRPMANLALSASILNAQPWKGNLHTPSLNTDSSGSAIFIYEVRLRRRDEAKICISSANLSDTVNYSLNVPVYNQALVIHPTDTTLHATADSSNETIIYVSLYDLTRSPIRNAIITIRPTPDSLGTIEPDTTHTDYFGWTQARFITHPNFYGMCWVYATFDNGQVFDRDSVRIEIRP